MQNKHTPGPWERTCYDVYSKSVVSHRQVSQCRPDNGEHAPRPTDEQECVANAKLIAASPDLLEAVLLALPLIKEIEKEDNKRLGHGFNRGATTLKVTLEKAINKATK